MALAAHMTRGLQLVLGSSKRALVERAEELQTETEEMPMTTILRSINTHNTINTPEATSLVEEVAELQHPPRSRDSLPTRRDSRESSPGAEDSRADFPPQVPLPPARATRWALAMASRLDMIIYASLFTFIGIPVYYTVGYAMPLQLTFSIMVYFAATSLPPNWKTYLHPVLVSSLFTVLGLWVLGLAKGHNLETTLREFRTGATYLRLWDASNSSSSSNGGGGGATTTTTTTTTRKLPGAGDVFASALDASIASLALPMYRYRRELRSHLLAIAVPNVAVSVGSLFAYPPLCAALGISAPRGLAFAVRSLTLALALPAAANLGADANTAAALPIAGGIIGALVGPRMLVWLGIPDDDYVTRGVTLGANSSAIATALLLRTDPRAAALSSLSMSLLGTVTVLFTSIPPIVVVIRSLVAL
ncbi:putative holin-like protein [Rosellinia necatrix]|uniref:Putative holin-like protein n=1 Tax=Rosellinia necatrix TaxID=77044 RepID=A0A1S8AAC5_ROSNE|nr:putative holin-like protein [Rosellinia necatrix]